MWPNRDKSRVSQWFKFFCTAFNLEVIFKSSLLCKLFVITKPRYLISLLTGILAILFWLQLWVARSSHFLRFKVRPDASEKWLILLIAFGTMYWFFRKRAVSSANWLTKQFLPQNFNTFYVYGVFKVLYFASSSAAKINKRGLIQKQNKAVMWN